MYRIVKASEPYKSCYWYFTKHGVMPGSVPKYINVLDILDKPEGSYFLADGIINTQDLDYFDIEEKGPEIVESSKRVFASKYNKFMTKTINHSEYAIHYTEVNTSPEADPRDIFENFKVQVSKIAPYDDAEYAWGDASNGTLTIHQNGKTMYKLFYLDPEDSDVDNDEWCDYIVDWIIEELEDVNKDIEPNMMYN